MSKHPTFADAAIEESFEKQGFVVLPFLEKAAIPKILEEFQQLRPSDGFRGMQETALMQQSFHVTFFDRNVEYRQQVFERIYSIFNDFALRELVNHRMVQGNIFLKPPKQGFVFPHQNLTITDEKQFRSISLWCPLQDTDLENGTLCVIPGSQEGFMRYRNTQVEWPLWEAFMPQGAATPYLVPLNVKAGQVVVLDDRLIHVTPENQTNSPRWVLHSLWLPASAPLRYFDVQLAHKKVHECAVQEDFWQFYTPGTEPMGLQEIAVHPYDEPQFTLEELLAHLEMLKKTL